MGRTEKRRWEGQKREGGKDRKEKWEGQKREGGKDRKEKVGRTERRRWEGQKGEGGKDRKEKVGRIRKEKELQEKKNDVQGRVGNQFSMQNDTLFNLINSDVGSSIFFSQEYYYN